MKSKQSFSTFLYFVKYMKTIIKIFALSFAFIFFSLFVTKPVRANTSNIRVPILMYHYIGDNPNPKDSARNSLLVTPDEFDQQMQYLSQNGYTPIDLNTLYAIYDGKATAPAKPVVLTFDDGYVDFYYTAFPILQKYNFHAVSFLPTGLIDHYPGFHLTWDEVKQMNASGLVEFEAHSVSHVNLNSVSNARLTLELRDSKQILEAEIGHPVNFVAYPYGAGNARVQAVARSLGFVGGLGTWYGVATGPSLNMPRIRINQYVTLSSFAAKLQ
jgi:peptidoglycan/xylan/chitin deacetylase (PgdA/CDA1 family)